MKNILFAILALTASGKVFADPIVDMNCYVSSGSTEFSVNAETDSTGKIVWLRAQNEAERYVVFQNSTEKSLNEITDHDANGAPDVNTLIPPPGYFIVAGNSAKGSLSLLVPAQNPIANSFTAYVAGTLPDLNVRIPMAMRVAAHCDKQVIAPATVK